MSTSSCPFASGDYAIHLHKGLSRITAIKLSVGSLHLVVNVGTEKLWVPVTAWREHLRVLPNRAQARRWLLRATTPVDPCPPGGAGAATRRLRTLDHHDFDRKLTAWVDAYRCGDRSPAALETLATLEAHLLPILAIALDRPIDAVRTELRAAMPEAVVPVEVPLPTLGPRFDPIGHTTLSATTVSGGLRAPEVRLKTLAGSWLGYHWTPHREHQGALIAIHAEYVGAFRELVASRKHVGQASSMTAHLLVYNPAIAADPAAADEIYDPIEWGLIDGGGFSLPLEDDLDYEVSVARHGGGIVCIVAGHLNALEERLLVNDDREQAALAALANWRRELRPDAPDAPDPESIPRAALAVLAELPPSAPIITELERVVEAIQDPDDAIATDAIALLAIISDPMPWFRRLTDEFARGRLFLVSPIADVLAATTHRELGDFVLEALAQDRAPWSDLRPIFLRALTRARHPGVEPVLRAAWQAPATSWTHINAGAGLLSLHPGDCAIARALIEVVESYDGLEREEPSRADWEVLADALSNHVRACERCRTSWVVVLFRLKRTAPPELEPLVALAPAQLAALTDTDSNDELWKWLEPRTLE